MIYWLSIPIPVPPMPPVEYVAYWLAVGSIVCAFSAFCYARQEALKGKCAQTNLAAILVIAIIWPLPLYLWAMKVAEGGRR